MTNEDKVKFAKELLFEVRDNLRALRSAGAVEVKYVEAQESKLHRAQLALSELEI
jgi:hypothetical protein